MDFRHQIIIDQPIEKVWEVLGDQYGQAYKWARGLSHSEGTGQPQLSGASCSNRTCQTTQGTIKEVITKFDTQNYVLQYAVIEGFPFFVDEGVNTWKLTKKGNKTQVDMHLVVTTKGVMGAVMRPMMKMQMNKLTSGVLGDFKHYVETGKPSPEKAKELQKAA